MRFRAKIILQPSLPQIIGVFLVMRGKEISRTFIMFGLQEYKYIFLTG